MIPEERMAAWGRPHLHFKSEEDSFLRSHGFGELQLGCGLILRTPA